MNDEQGHATYDRPAWSARFFARLHRYRNLLLRRWWVPALCIGLALGLEGAYLRFAPPQFVSVGQMIVSIKLNLQQGSFYTEELNNFLGTQAALMQGAEVETAGTRPCGEPIFQPACPAGFSGCQRVAEDDDLSIARHR